MFKVTKSRDSKSTVEIFLYFIIDKCIILKSDDFLMIIPKKIKFLAIISIFKCIIVILSIASISAIGYSRINPGALFLRFFHRSSKLAWPIF